MQIDEVFRTSESKKIYKALNGFHESLNDKKFNETNDHVRTIIDMLERVRNLFESNHSYNVYLNFLNCISDMLINPTFRFRWGGYKKLNREFKQETTEFVINCIIPYMAVTDVHYTCFVLGGYGGDA